MGCDHPSFVPVGPLVGQLWHFQYFLTWRPAVILNLKKIFDHVTIVVVLIYCCVQSFIKIVSTFGLQTPITAECSMCRCEATAVDMATALWRTCREHDEMRPPKFHTNRSIDRRFIAFTTFCNMAAVRHLEFVFCYSRPPIKSTMWFDYHVKIWCRSDLPRRRYCDFIIVPLWQESA